MTMRAKTLVQSLPFLIDKAKELLCRIKFRSFLGGEISRCREEKHQRWPTYCSEFGIELRPLWQKANELISAPTLSIERQFSGLLNEFDRGNSTNQGAVGAQTKQLSSAVLFKCGSYRFGWTTNGTVLPTWGVFPFYPLFCWKHIKYCLRFPISLRIWSLLFGYSVLLLWSVFHWFSNSSSLCQWLHTDELLEFFCCHPIALVFLKWKYPSLLFPYRSCLLELFFQYGILS